MASTMICEYAGWLDNFGVTEDNGRDGSQPDIWRYIVEVQKPGLQVEPMEYH